MIDKETRAVSPDATKIFNFVNASRILDLASKSFLPTADGDLGNVGTQFPSKADRPLDGPYVLKIDGPLAQG